MPDSRRTFLVVCGLLQNAEGETQKDTATVASPQVATDGVDDDSPDWGNAVLGGGGWGFTVVAAQKHAYSWGFAHSYGQQLGRHKRDDVAKGVHKCDVGFDMTALELGWAHGVALDG